ncbi:MAG: hypothetical protein ACQESJ_03695 [Bacteroidota bacterium]
MSQNRNQLIADDTTLMETITKISSKVVSRYIARSVIPLREKEDVEMAIIEKFLDKKEKINGAFEGKSKPATYYTAVINRMCCEIIRKEQKHWYSLPDDQQHENENQNSVGSIFESEKGAAINNEVKRLSKAMLFFNGTSAKVNLFLKYYYNISLNDNDFISYSEENKNYVKDVLLNQKVDSKAGKFEKLAKLVNKVEGKNVKGDAVRIWLNKQTDTLVKRLNNNNASNHNAESLGLLFEIKETKMS